MINDARPGDLGQMVILPSSFQGGPRHMHEYTQDALTYVRRYGRPDLFITFTCNPLWQDIKDLLFPGQSPSDRHDLIARVFKQKLSILLQLITKSHVFGELNAWMYSIEWQKRGLPHSHMLVWLKNHIHGSDVDKVISAEIPNKEIDPELYGVVTSQMVHGPCGTLNPNSPCMVNGKCSKGYPKQYLSETMSGNDGYPQYRRRKPEEGGFCTKMQMKTSQGFHEVEIDNRWVVPYSPLLSKIFHAHINVESCHSVKAIKYMCKYVNKGSDQAVFEFSNSSDEVQEFLMGRYISSNEAVWRILGFSLHERSPAVVHLSVHLENGQRVYFTEHNLQGKLQTPPATTLTAFFDLCRQDPFARTLLYCDVPTYYTWNVASKTFQRRKRGKAVDGHLDIKASDALGRVYTVHPANAECFYLRMLLHIVRGPTSFADLKTVDGQECETYRETCLKRGLLEDDRHWEEALREACATRSAARLRHLYCILLTTCSLANPLHLWDKFKDEMSADILHNLRRQNPELNVQITPDVQNQTLILLEDLCMTMAGKHINQYSLPSPIRDHSNSLRTEILQELSYDRVQLHAFVAEKEPLLEANQKAAYKEVLRRVENQDGVILFLDAPGGTGKTYVINLLLAKLRSQSSIALAVASSGIAATLLHGGRTAHSAFKLPLQLAHCDTVPTCNIAKGSGLAQLLQECKLIVWDECTMAHKHALEALDLTLRDLKSNDQVMGGTVVLLAGDFRQTLPVIPKSTPADELNACLKASHLWRNVRKLALTKNMRVHVLGDECAELFSKQLLALGDGKISADTSDGRISFPTNFCCMVDSQLALQTKVFPDIQLNFTNTQWLCERVILASKNDSVFRINKRMLGLLPGEIKSYKAIDTVDDPTDPLSYRISEFTTAIRNSTI
ncbi:uncharacterized protein LOC129720539 [Wyeomyia smithii]|uniref:uncharacterized protein LOC129720539 n=1 Tax=Wyeomyia smithii TaxID=174621 RepID=UPI002467ACB0|nr:uncharacterized protein LOC129720539 [Wyeomyia smithii]